LDIVDFDFVREKKILRPQTLIKKNALTAKGKIDMFIMINKFIGMPKFCKIER
jgi:hypothetical protein